MCLISSVTIGTTSFPAAVASHLSPHTWTAVDQIYWLQVPADFGLDESLGGLPRFQDSSRTSLFSEPVA